MEQKKDTSYIGYEYKEVIADSDMIPLLMDGYEHFGWEITQKNKVELSIPNASVSGKEKLHLRRDRHMINKVELTRLQRNFEACINEIGQLEKSKTSKATVCALVIAMIGTAFMAGSVFAVTATTPNIVLTIVFGVPAIIGWLLPYFVYKKIHAEEIKRLNPIIESKYDEIHEICEKGHKLTH